MLLKAWGTVCKAPGVVGTVNALVVPTRDAKPFRSTAIAAGEIIPPMRPQYCRVDREELNFAMNILGLPTPSWTNAPGVVGKSRFPVPTLVSIVPVTYKLPIESRASPVALSAEVPPSNVELRRCDKVGSSTAIKASSFPFNEVEYAPAVVGKLVDLDRPATYTLPKESRVIAVASSKSLPPR